MLLPIYVDNLKTTCTAVELIALNGLFHAAYAITYSCLFGLVDSSIT